MKKKCCRSPFTLGGLSTNDLKHQIGFVKIDKSPSKAYTVNISKNTVHITFASIKTKRRILSEPAPEALGFTNNEAIEYIFTIPYSPIVNSNLRVLYKQQIYSISAVENKDELDEVMYVYAYKIGQETQKNSYVRK